MGGPININRSTQPLTIPEEFSFATTHRFGAKQAHLDAATEPPQPKRRKVDVPEGGITIPEPFHLTSDDRIRTKHAIRQASGLEPDQPQQPWESLAATVKRLQNATPDRFKRVPVRYSNLCIFARLKTNPKTLGTAPEIAS